MPYEVRETANRAQKADLTTYFTPGYALGTASRTYEIGTDCFYIEHEANYLMLHYQRPPEHGGWGMAYSRFVVNDRHWGTMGPAPDRPKTGNFYDHGHFAGVQKRNKAIGLYALMPEQQEVFSLKTVVAFQSGPDLERVWINDRPAHENESSTALTADDWLIVEDGAVYVAVRALEQSVLGQNAPIRLERGPLGELWLSIYNYEGAPIRFWDYASLKGAFWRGNLRAGFVLEVAERADFPSAKAFLSHLRQAVIVDDVDDTHIRTVTYASADDALTLRYDLWNTQPVERLLDGKLYRAPQLSSPLAVQGDSGRLHLGEATLYTQPRPFWMVAQVLGGDRVYVIANPTARPTSLRLNTPEGEISAAAWGLGRIEWRIGPEGEQHVVVDGTKLPDGLQVPEGAPITLRPSWLAAE
jgi:hypothetical protein